VFLLLLEFRASNLRAVEFQVYQHDLSIEEKLYQ